MLPLLLLAVGEGESETKGESVVEGKGCCCAAVWERGCGVGLARWVPLAREITFSAAPSHLSLLFLLQPLKENSNVGYFITL